MALITPNVHRIRLKEIVPHIDVRDLPVITPDQFTVHPGLGPSRLEPAVTHDILPQVMHPQSLDLGITSRGGSSSSSRPAFSLGTRQVCPTNARHSVLVPPRATRFKALCQEIRHALARKRSTHARFKTAPETASTAQSSHQAEVVSAPSADLNPPSGHDPASEKVRRLLVPDADLHPSLIPPAHSNSSRLSHSDSPQDSDLDEIPVLSFPDRAASMLNLPTSSDGLPSTATDERRDSLEDWDPDGLQSSCIPMDIPDHQTDSQASTPNRTPPMMTPLISPSPPPPSHTPHTSSAPSHPKVTRSSPPITRSQATKTKIPKPSSPVTLRRCISKGRIKTSLKKL